MLDPLYRRIDDAQRYRMLANRASSALSCPVAVSQDEELAAFLWQVARESQHHAEEAKRLLAQRVAE